MSATSRVIYLIELSNLDPPITPIYSGHTTTIHAATSQARRTLPFYQYIQQARQKSEDPIIIFQIGTLNACRLHILKRVCNNL